MQNKLLRAGKRGRFVRAARVWHWVPAERCSQEWMFKRAYKNGLSCGRRSDPKKTPAVFGRPPRVLLQLARGQSGRGPRPAEPGPRRADPLPHPPERPETPRLRRRREAAGRMSPGRELRPCVVAKPNGPGSRLSELRRAGINRSPNVRP